MIIVWGTKARYLKAGFAASFCPFCRDLREFEVREVRKVSHIYYIPLGKGKLVGYRLECKECSAQVLMNEAPGLALSPNRSTCLAEAIQETNPSLLAEYADRLELETQIRSGKVPPPGEERWSLLHEPFQVLAPTMERGAAETRIDLPSTLGCLGTIVAVLISVVAVDFLSTRFSGIAGSQDWFLWAILGVGLIGTAVTLWQMYLGTRRWLERSSVPHICRALSPLRPTTEEIQQIVDQYRKHGMKFAKHLRVSAFESRLGLSHIPNTQSANPLEPK